MKKKNIQNRLNVYKEKLVNLQIKVIQLEKKMAGKNDEVFGDYKPLIEAALNDLEFSILSCEVNLNRIESLQSETIWVKGFDGSELLKEELKFSEKFFKPEVERVNELLKECENYDDTIQ